MLLSESAVSPAKKVHRPCGKKNSGQGCSAFRACLSMSSTKPFRFLARNRRKLFLKPCGQHLPRNRSTTTLMTQHKPAGLTVAKCKDERQKKQTSCIAHRRVARWVLVRRLFSVGRVELVDPL